MKIVDLAAMEYAEAFALQERLVADVAAGRAEETLLLLEHPPVYTLGRGGGGESLPDPSVRPVEINRGGDVTWHGPGQLVGYPILDLGRRGRDLHRYLRFLEQALMAAAAAFEVAAWRVPGRTGIWTDGGKLASIGVGVRRWVTMHGFALNVCNDLAPFSRIHPCGIAGCPVTTLSREAGRAITVADAKAAVAAAFAGLPADALPEQPRDAAVHAAPCDEFHAPSTTSRRPPCPLTV
ncbi:lipoyl(octanoyl) transferase LipB [Geobacter anodireducens]|uniref:Octanoyltransferase n=1 Tax=Geobacter soli TaxID=1510391 RepID=A0A0C1QSZ4_9BACT|nr:lipoyl(octanoyl) transferase LipB [Geobacter soli]KIE44127.1 octanoyltransferase [Geobacter soli]